MNRWLVGTTVALATALTAPGIAWGGGFATVGLSSLPDGLRPGQPWVVELTVLQHGRTPLDGLRPAVTVAPADGGAVGRTFPARPTGEPGVYAARVVFPSAGRWRYEVDDGFTSTHTYAPVQIGGPPAAARPQRPTRLSPRCSAR